MSIAEIAPIITTIRQVVVGYTEGEHTERLRQAEQRHEKAVIEVRGGNITSESLRESQEALSHFFAVGSENVIGR